MVVGKLLTILLGVQKGLFFRYILKKFQGGYITRHPYPPAGLLLGLLKDVTHPRGANTHEELNELRG